jgi:seryl-tRNA synthetase
MDIKKIDTRIAQLERKLNENQKKLDVFQERKITLINQISDMKKLRKREEEVERIWGDLTSTERGDDEEKSTIDNSLQQSDSIVLAEIPRIAIKDNQ